MQTLGDYENAFKYLHLAKSNTPKKTSEYAAITDAIGLNYFFIGNLKKAESYFKETAEMAIEINDSIRYAKAIGNLALIKQKNGNIEDAISLLNKDLRISEKTENDQNTIYASALLIELYIENKDWDKAGETLKKIKNFKGSKTYSQKKELEIIKLELKILQHQNKTNGELSLRRRMSVLEESLKNKEDDMAIGKANWMIQKTKFEKKIDKAENQIKKESELKNFYAIIIILFLLLSFFLFKNFKKQLKTKKLQHQNDLLEFELEKTKADQKLLEANKNLNAQIDYLKEKNIQIKKLKEEINNVKKSPPSVNIEKKTGKLNTLLESHLMTENNWISFKSEFEKEHPEFYRLLEEDFPEITNSNKRILLLQKLNFSKNEIAELLGITNDAVKKSLQRLKKKLGDKFNVLSNHIN